MGKERAVRDGLVVLVLLSLAACAEDSEQQLTAKLSAPACVEVGETVTFDASGSVAGAREIVKYIFSIQPDDRMDGEGTGGEGGQYELLTDPDPDPLLVERAPKIQYTFQEPVVYRDTATGKKFFGQYLVRLEVRDQAGGTAEDAIAVFVVFDKETQCLEVMPEPVLDVVSQETFEDVVVQAETSDGGSLDAAPPDFPSIDVLGPDTVNCKTIAGLYSLKLYCYGTVASEIPELELTQDGCDLVSVVPGGDVLLAGTVALDGTVTLSSPIPEMNMPSCSGPSEHPEMLSLECTNDCTAVLTLL
jgi:hypothetical protein